MAQHNDLGIQGEILALSFLQNKGWQILETNWRTGKAEIDIIAMHDDVLVFVEVKTRSSDLYSKPEEAVSEKKIRLLTNASGVYMQRIQHDWEVRFDIVSILIKSNRAPQIRHIQDAFFSGIAE